MSDLSADCLHSLYREFQANIDVTVPARENTGRHTRGRAVFMSLCKLRDSTRMYESDSRASVAATDRERMSDRALIHLTDTSRTIARTFVACDIFQRAKIALRGRRFIAPCEKASLFLFPCVRLYLVLSCEEKISKSLIMK